MGGSGVKKKTAGDHNDVSMPGGTAETPKGRGRGGPSPGGPPSKRPKLNAGGGGRAAGTKPKTVAPVPLPAPPPVVEAGYQSDEDDTAEPMSYDEKRQVSQAQLVMWV